MAHLFINSGLSGNILTVGEEAHDDLKAKNIRLTPTVRV